MSSQDVRSACAVRDRRLMANRKSDQPTLSVVLAIPGCCRDAVAGLADTNEVRSRLGAPQLLAWIETAADPAACVRSERPTSYRPLGPLSAPSLVQSPLRL